MPTLNFSPPPPPPLAPPSLALSPQAARLSASTDAAVIAPNLRTFMLLLLVVVRSVREDLAEEVLGAIGLGCGEEALRVVLLHDLPAVHEDHPVGCLAREPHLMGHDDHGHA